MEDWDTVLVTSASQKSISSANKRKTKIESQENKDLSKNLQGCTVPVEPLIKQDRSGIGYEFNL